MKCFNHKDIDAVGLCKSCGKGLCEDCVVEIPNGLACKGACEARSMLLNKMIDRNLEMSEYTEKVSRFGAAQRSGQVKFFITMGIVFAVFGAWFCFRTLMLPIGLLFLFIGSGYILYGINVNSKAKKFPWPTMNPIQGVPKEPL